METVAENLVDGMRLNNAFFRNAPNQYLGLVDVYDTERTADLFCAIVNRWHETSNNPGAVSSGVI